VKATQTGILWSQVQVLVGPPEKQTLISNGEGFVLVLTLIYRSKAIHVMVDLEDSSVVPGVFSMCKVRRLGIYHQ